MQRIQEVLEEMKEALELVCGEEEDAMNNVPESLQESERYQKMDDAVGEMENAISCLEDAIQSLEVASE